MTITLIDQACDITIMLDQVSLSEKLVKKIGFSVQVFMATFRYCVQSLVSSCLTLL